jgi:hypothetical protein
MFRWRKPSIKDAHRTAQFAPLSGRPLQGHFEENRHRDCEQKSMRGDPAQAFSGPQASREFTVT